MNLKKVELRPLRRDDFDDVVEIDELVLNQSRSEYYETKFTRALDQKDRLAISLVAEEGEKVVGFVMSELFVGEYDIPATTATLDTIGVHPDYQKKGVGEQLMA